MRHVRTARCAAVLLRLSAGALALSVPLAAPAHADAQSESKQEYLRGYAAFEAGDYRTARIHFLNALKENPNNGLARLMQARVALELGAGVEAQTELERAVAAGIPAEKVHHLRAHALLLQGKRGEALQILNSNALEPQFQTYAERLRGQIHLADRNMEAARRSFARALAMGPEDPATVAAAARFHAATGDADRAAELIDELLEKRPNNVDALLIKGDLVRRTRGLEAALPYFSRVLEIDRNNIQALLERAATLGDLGRDADARRDLARVGELVEAHPVALFLEAMLEAREGDYDKARELMTRTRGMVDQYAPAAMLQGLLALQANNVDQAIGHLSQLVARMPNLIPPRQALAAAQLKKGDAEQAMATLQPILDAKVADARTLALAGQAATRLGRMDDAQRYLAAAAEAGGGDTNARGQLAMTQMMQGQAALAEDTVRGMLAEDEDSISGLMMLALVQMQQRDFPAAVRISNRLVKAHPELAVGYNLRGGALLGTGERKRAEANFRKALQLKPDYPEARRNLAQILKANGQIEEAKEQLRRVVLDNAKDVRALLALGELAGIEGDHEEQIEWLQQAVAVDREAVQPRAALAQAYAAAGDEQRALNEARALIRDHGTNTQALMAGARIFEVTGQQAELVPLFRRLADQQPDSVWPKALLGRSLVLVDRPDEAREAFQSALEGDDPAEATVLGELIALEAREGDAAAARRWAAQLQAKLPNGSNQADVLLGNALLVAGNAEAARAAFVEARETRATFDAIRGLAQAEVKLGRTKEALATLEAYRKQNPKDAGVLAAIAEMQLGQKQYRAAIANYEAVRKATEVDNAAVLNNLAYAYTEIDDPRAVAVARQAHEMVPDNASIADTYAWALLSSGENPKLALSLLYKAAMALPNNPDIRYHLAQAYRMNGQREKAIEQVRQALKVPSFDSRPQAERLLTRLQAG